MLAQSRHGSGPAEGPLPPLGDLESVRFRAVDRMSVFRLGGMTALDPLRTFRVGG